VSVIRYLEKWVSADGAMTYTFPLKGMTWSETGGLRTPDAPAVGADGSHDFLGTGIAVRDPVIVSVSFLDVQTSAANVESDIDNLRSKLHIGAYGKLWALASDGTRRWSPARVIAMPEHPRAVGQFTHMPATAKFRREPYFYSESATSISQALSAYQTIVSVVNPGNAYVKKGLTLLLTATAIGGWTTPSIRNLTTGEVVSTARTAPLVGSVWQIDQSAAAIQYQQAPGLVVGKAGSYVGAATVGGSNYMDDYGNATLGDAQGGSFVTLAPGTNQLEVLIAGTPAATLTGSFYGAWE
jgi:hypothetical protein